MKKLNTSITIFYISMFLLMSALTVQSKPIRHGLNNPEFVPGEILLKYKDDVGFSIIEEYKKGPNVEYAEPNYILHRPAIPNDPTLSGQWGITKAQAVQGWDIETGEPSVTVAVIDTGVLLLEKNLTVTKNGTGTGTVYGHGIICGDDCQESFYDNTQTTLTAISDYTSTFAGWSGGGCSGTGQCIVIMDAEKTVTATFTLKTYKITASAGDHGSIFPAGDVAVNYGDDLTFTITPDPGYRVADVQVNGKSVGAVKSHTFYNISADQTFNASFAVDDSSVIDVTAHGAIPNDGSNDLAEIYDAINSASDGDTVFFPAGRYHITGTINIKPTETKCVNLKGAGQNQTIILHADAIVSSMIGIEDCSNIEISEMTLDGNSVNAKAKLGISALWGSGHDFHHLTIRNIMATDDWAPRAIHLYEVTNSIVHDNLIENIAPDNGVSAGLMVTNNSTNNNVLRNKIQSVGGYGIKCLNSEDPIIRYNTVFQSGMNNNIDEGIGIELTGCHTALVEDNFSDHWISVDSTYICAVRRNIVSDKTGLTTHKFAGLELADSSNCIFTNNIVNDGAQIGISISNNSATSPPEHIFWAYNTIQNARTWGASIQGNNAPAHSHYFYMNRFLNTDEDDTAALPAELHGDTAGHGFRLFEYSSNITIENNEFLNNIKDGIRVPDNTDISWLPERLSFIENTIRDNNGISVSGISLDSIGELEWESNIVQGNKEDIQLISRGFENQEKPVASFTPTISGMEVQFENNSSDNDGNIVHWLWDFGEGLPSIVKEPQYTYNSEGTYQVSLIVWDNDGRAARTEQEIVINAIQDRDGDGVPDHQDAFPDDPNEWEDTDGDGIGNNADPDDDNDGLSDIDEMTITLTDPLNPDTDNDGINDGDEDFDLDGRSNFQELAEGTSVVNPDVELKMGFNIFAYPTEVLHGLTAFDLLQALGGETDVVSVQRLNPIRQMFEQAYYIEGVPQGTDFPVEGNESYLVNMLTDKQVTLTGSSECPTYDLVSGMNLVGFPCFPAGFTTYDLLMYLGSEFEISSIQIFDSKIGQFRTTSYFSGAPAGFRIPLVAGQGIFVYMKKPKEAIVSPITPPVVQVTNPSNGDTLNTTPITVTGTVDDLAVIVDVNRVIATVDGSGNFTASPVPLAEGLNELTVVARNINNLTAHYTIEVTLDSSE